MSSCPSALQFEAHARGSLPAAEREALERHAASCAACAGALRSAREEEALFRELKGAVVAGGTVSAGGSEAGAAADPNLTLSSDASVGRHPTPVFDPRGPMSVVSDDVMATISSDAPSKPSAARSAGAPSQLFEIEGYEILAELSRGGQGAVYKAVQKATKRTVALKVLLAGDKASRRQLERFEREIDLAAGLRHPNIITVYDSGVAAGLHYLVMEFVRGDRLDVYLARKRPTLEQTLRLFLKVCGAVGHAHRHGVIHRDLKPGNILVDSAGEPYILDFGLAKAVGRDVLQGRGLTLTAEFVGTLAYASPEQTEGRPELIDVRTDVYSLGVILYEMVTGHLPYSVAGAIGDVLRNIAEAQPEKPSSWHTKAKAAKEDGIPITAHRIQDDLETIILKSLAKEPDRRYQSVDGLGGDIQRFLSGEAVDAKRDSALYVLRKMAMRYKAASFVILLVGIIVVSFGGISYFQYGKTAEAYEQLDDQARELRRSNENLAATLRTIDESASVGGLGWFLLHLREGRTEVARTLQTGYARRLPLAKITAFLLDEAYTIERLVGELPPRMRGLAWYAAGERHTLKGELAQALTAYEASVTFARADDDDMTVREAMVRFNAVREKLNGGLSPSP